jgi:hypothetical protein
MGSKAAEMPGLRDRLAGRFGEGAYSRAEHPFPHEMSRDADHRAI